MNGFILCRLLLVLALSLPVLGPGEPGCQGPAVPVVCVPACGEQECGADPACGEPCGECLAGEQCSAEGFCEPELVCEPGFADCVDGMSVVCLDDGSGWAGPLPCNPNETPRFTYVFEPPYGRGDGRDCVAIVAGERRTMAALLGNLDSYRTVTLRLESYGSSSETYPTAPGSWFVPSAREVVIPPLRSARVPFDVVVPAETAPDLYRLSTRAVLTSSAAVSGGVTWHLAIGKRLLVDVLAPGEGEGGR